MTGGADSSHGVWCRELSSPAPRPPGPRLPRPQAPRPSLRRSAGTAAPPSPSGVGKFCENAAASRFHRREISSRSPGRRGRSCLALPWEGRSSPPGSGTPPAGTAGRNLSTQETGTPPSDRSHLQVHPSQCFKPPGSSRIMSSVRLQRVRHHD